MLQYRGVYMKSLSFFAIKMPGHIKRHKAVTDASFRLARNSSTSLYTE